MLSTIRHVVRRGLAAARYLMSYARGYYVRASARVRGIPFTAGRNFRVTGKLVLRGPGRVVFGDNVLVDRVVTPWTYSPEALIEIGSNSYLNGTRFGCVSLIRIGAGAILGDASIQDTDFHSVRADRHRREAPIRVRPVVIDENVWLASAVGVLPGTTIGRNSVVGYGAVCAGSYPPDSVIVGNPAKAVKEVPPAPSEAPVTAPFEKRVSPGRGVRRLTPS